MPEIQCKECQSPYDAEEPVCPHCGAAAPERIPVYPRFGGKVFVVLWVLFLTLIVIWLISLISFQ